MDVVTPAWRASKPCVFVGATVVHAARVGEHGGMTRCGLWFDALWPGVYSVDGFRRAPPFITGRPDCGRCEHCFAPWEDERHPGPDKPKRDQRRDGGIVVDWPPARFSGLGTARLARAPQRLHAAANLARGPPG